MSPEVVDLIAHSTPSVCSTSNPAGRCQADLFGEALAAVGVMGEVLSSGANGNTSSSDHMCHAEEVVLGRVEGSQPSSGAQIIRSVSSLSVLPTIAAPAAVWPPPPPAREASSGGGAGTGAAPSGTSMAAGSMVGLGNGSVPSTSLEGLELGAMPAVPDAMAMPPDAGAALSARRLSRQMTHQNALAVGEMAAAAAGSLPPLPRAAGTASASPVRRHRLRALMRRAGAEFERAFDFALNELSLFVMLLAPSALAACGHSEARRWRLWLLRPLYALLCARLACALLFSLLFAPCALDAMPLRATVRPAPSPTCAVSLGGRERALEPAPLRMRSLAIRSNAATCPLRTARTTPHHPPHSRAPLLNF